MKKIIILCSIIILISSDFFAQEILSPNEKIKVIIKQLETDDKNYGSVFFQISYKNDEDYLEILPHSPLGINRKDTRFADNLKYIGESEVVDIKEQYEMIHGKRRIRKNFGIEKSIYFINSEDQKLNISFRVFNDGVAFRYSFPNQSDSLINIISEETVYNILDNTHRWLQPYSDVYEDFFPFSKDGNDDKNKYEWGYPALFKTNDMPIWMLISEANISKVNCGSRLNNIKNPNEYKVVYPPERDSFKQTGVITTLPWDSPWRTVIIGELSDIVESTMITDVCEPNSYEDVSWIKPGAVSWIYWAYNHGSKDYKRVIEYVDLAVEMNWPYVLIDWEWDVMSNGGDLIDAVTYANEKGIKPLMWYNSGTSWLDPTPVDRLLTKEKREKEFNWLNEIGVYGIKVDFFAGDQQDMMKYYIDILEDAAKYKLMVNFHGATIPRGWSRTYPNLMTIEAVYGAEWYNNRPDLTDKAAKHNAILPFTRNVIGSMDYTPVTFSNSQHPHITSYGHELALSVIFESGLQHFADSPESYNSLPPKPKDFLKNIPISWDDTKLIDGYPGENVIIARKKGDQWYIGGINGTNEKQIATIIFDFLKNGNYTLELIKDGSGDKSFSYETLNIKNGDVVKIPTLSRGGFTGILKN